MECRYTSSLPVVGGNNSLSFDGLDNFVNTGISYTELTGASEMIIDLTFKRRPGINQDQYQGLSGPRSRS